MAAPIVHVPYEVINQWEDWVPHLDLYLEESTTYTADEVGALAAFQVQWERAAAALSDDYPSIHQAQGMPEWEVMRQAAEASLAVFSIRGKLPEDTKRSKRVTVGGARSAAWSGGTCCSI